MLFLGDLNRIKIKRDYPVWSSSFGKFSCDILVNALADLSSLVMKDTKGFFNDISISSDLLFLSFYTNSLIKL
jgi:hypothetical protein